MSSLGDFLTETKKREFIESELMLSKNIFGLNNIIKA